MSDIQNNVLARLRQWEISYEVMEHAPVHTMEDCKIVEQHFGVPMPKNLFLTPRNQSAFYLCVVRPQISFKTADVSRQIGSSRLSFASAEKLWDLLRTLPGAISPLGLLFDEDVRVQLLMDRALQNASVLVFHPCENTASVALTSEAFFDVFLPAVHRKPVWIDV